MEGAGREGAGRASRMGEQGRGAGREQEGAGSRERTVILIF